MYQIDTKKRYNVEISPSNEYAFDYSFEKVELIAVDNGIVVIKDEGKEHIFTGAVAIHIAEV